MGRTGSSGLYAVQAAPTAASAVAESESKITTCESASGASTTMSGPDVTIDHPPGAVKVAPPDVVTSLSAVSFSAGDREGVCAGARAAQAIVVISNDARLIYTFPPTRVSQRRSQPS